VQRLHFNEKFNDSVEAKYLKINCRDYVNAYGSDLCPEIQENCLRKNFKNKI